MTDMSAYEAAYSTPLNMVTLRAAEYDNGLVRFARMHLDHSLARESDLLRRAQERLDKLQIDHAKLLGFR